MHLASCALALSLFSVPPLCAQFFTCDEPIRVDAELAALETQLRDSFDPYAYLSERHKLVGTASYYSGFFEGRKTANGEIFKHDRYTAAHLTLPLGTWVEVVSMATGRRLRLRVNDRGPYSGGFVLDLSRSAARFLGVDRARDRRVTIRILALPGEKPPPEPSTGEEAKTASAEN